MEQDCGVQPRAPRISSQLDGTVVPGAPVRGYAYTMTRSLDGSARFTMRPLVDCKAMLGTFMPGRWSHAPSSRGTGRVAGSCIKLSGFLAMAGREAQIRISISRRVV